MKTQTCEFPGCTDAVRERDGSRGRFPTLCAEHRITMRRLNTRRRAREFRARQKALSPRIGSKAAS